MIKHNSRKYFAILMIAISLSTTVIITGCKKFIDIDAPITYTSTENAFKNDATATAILTGLYARLSSEFTTDVLSTSYYTELSSDNLVLFDPDGKADLRNFYLGTLEPNYSDYAGTSYFWNSSYNMLYTINNAIIELEKSTLLRPKVRQQLLGEAYFLRAFHYFYLTNLFGDVPLVLSINHGATSKQSRNSVTEVYQQIEKDLATAESMLVNEYADIDVSQPTSDRLRPNLGAVNALQARIFLYQKKYAEAESAATKVISQTNTYSFGELNQTFLKNSSETIWALQPVTIGFNTNDANLFLLTEDGPDLYHPVYLSENLINAFEPGDARRTSWTASVTVTNAGVDKTYPFAAKYKVPLIGGSTEINEYTIVLRLAEQYLIRAEAKNEQNNISGAIEDINAIRNRSRASDASIPDPLPVLQNTLSQTQLREAILHERQVELFTEWGHRWFDLKRVGIVEQVMTPVLQARGGVWSNYKALYPIPSSEIRLNSALTQNQGYN